MREPQYDGAYYLIRNDLFPPMAQKHTSGLVAPVSVLHLRALNIVQATPWRINGWILDIMREAWLTKSNLPGLPMSDPEPLPERLPDHVWRTLDGPAKADVKTKRAAVHARNASLIGQRLRFIMMLDAATALVDHSAIYYPHYLDFRGRMYPFDQSGLSPQGDDRARALLMFAEGKELGERGLFWLCIRLANTFGEDKGTFAERLAWVAEHHHAILDSGRDPLDGMRFWTQADEPWTFLATAREYYLAHQRPFGSPEKFVSHLPIQIDGSINGIQHLSALGRDPEGARLTNMRAIEKRFDLYQEVADEVAKLVSADAVRGVPEAYEWAGRVTRKVVKRAVMTTPYGVTPRGIQEQLINDGFTEHIEDAPFSAAGYLRDRIVDAMQTKASGAKAIMAYIQGVAYALAQADIPMTWTTPSGMIVQQGYYNLVRKRVNTVVGRTVLWNPDDEMGLNARKQALASAPNVIHSFDAAHLVHTVNDLHDLHGVGSFSMIHDSYGTHAADTDRLYYVLRRAFLDIYAEDQLGRFHREMKTLADQHGIVLPDPPPLGDYDLSEILEAPYFFA